MLVFAPVCLSPKAKPVIEYEAFIVEASVRGRQGRIGAIEF